MMEGSAIAEPYISTDLTKAVDTRVTVIDDRLAQVEEIFHQVTHCTRTLKELRDRNFGPVPEHGEDENIKAIESSGKIHLLQDRLGVVFNQVCELKSVINDLNERL